MVRVLIVEDDPLVRQNVADYLTDAGFEVLEAETGDEALNLLVAHEPVDLIFTDVHMPGRANGNKVGLIAKQLRPGLPVIHTSARPRAPDAPPGAADLFIPKPYALADVLAAIRRLVRG